MAPTSPPAPNEYLLDSAWHAERERLNSLTGLYDARSLEVCLKLGLSEGWRCADIGAGTGSLAHALLEHVGATGVVLAVDADTRFLEPIASERLQVLRRDVTAEPLPPGELDLVHARLLLEHLPARDPVLESMVRSVRSGGWVVVEDFDWVTAAVVDPPSPVHERVVAAAMAVFAQAGLDSGYGRTLPRRLAALGLTDVRTHAEAAQVQAHRARGVPQWELLVDQLTPALLAAGLVTPADLDAFHALWHDGATVCFAPLMVSCAGRRP
jgi:SAM-dependent methyltransferase